jgi:hypothetical protein
VVRRYARLARVCAAVCLLAELLSVAGNAAVCKTLLLGGVAIDERDRASGGKGGTALHVAAHCSHEAVIRVLLQHGADTTLKDDADRTPLQLAEEQKNGAMVSRLIQQELSLKARISATIDVRASRSATASRSCSPALCAAAKSRVQRRSRCSRQGQCAVAVGPLWHPHGLLRCFPLLRGLLPCCSLRASVAQARATSCSSLIAMASEPVKCHCRAESKSSVFQIVCSMLTFSTCLLASGRALVSTGT